MQNDSLSLGLGSGFFKPKCASSHNQSSCEKQHIKETKQTHKKYSPSEIIAYGLLSEDSEALKYLTRSRKSSP